MRIKFLLLPFFIFIALQLAAQTNLPHGRTTGWADPFEPLAPYLHAQNDRSISSFDMNYSAANGDNSVYIFQTNYHFALPADSSFKWFTVGFDSIHSSSSNTGYDWHSISTMHIDSIMIYMGHENNSFTPDTFIVKLIALNATGYPTNTVYWADTLISTTSMVSPFNTWLFPQVKRFYPNYTFNGPAHFGIRTEFLGSHLDTLGIMAGFVNGGFCPYYGSSVSALRSHFYPNSYYFFTTFGAQYPTAAGGNIYIDCNGSGSYQLNSNEEYYLQNINIWPHVTANILQVIANTSSYSICNGQSAPLIANPIDGTGPYTYQWSPAASLNNATVFNPNASPTQTTIYTCTVTDAHGAKANDTVIVIVRPNFTVSNDTTVCVGQAAMLNTFGGPCQFFLWTPNVAISNQSIANPIVGPTSTTTYTCECTGFDGCVGTQDVVVNITQHPIANFNIVPTGMSVAFNNLSSGANSFVWHFGDGNGSGLPYPTHVYATTGAHVVTLIAYNNCGSDTIIDTIYTFGLGMQMLAADKVFGIVPNPGTDVIRLTNFYLHPGDEVIILNEVGQQVYYRNNYEGREKQIDVSKFSNGVYFVQLRTAYGKWTQKWIKE